MLQSAEGASQPALPSIPAAGAGKEAVVAAAVSSVFIQMDADVKSTALKTLQVHTTDFVTMQ